MLTQDITDVGNDAGAQELCSIGLDEADHKEAAEAHTYAQHPIEMLPRYASRMTQDVRQVWVVWPLPP